MTGEPLHTIIKRGDIIFSSPTSWLFKFIQYWTRDKWCHVAIVVDIVDSHIFVVEALPFGIDVNDLVWYEKEKKDFIVYRLKKLNDELINKIISHTLKFIGSGYDFLALGNFLLAKPLLGSKKRYYCSELIYRILTYLKLIKKSEKAEMISPHDLRLLIENESNIVYKKEAEC